MVWINLHLIETFHEGKRAAQEKQNKKQAPEKELLATEALQLQPKEKYYNINW